VVNTTDSTASGIFASFPIIGANPPVIMYRRIEFFDAPNAGLGAIKGPISSLTITGHSLGGHLATAFARLFPNIPVEVATVNGMGTGSDSRVGAFFDALAERQGTSFPENRIANVFGSAGPNLATGELLYNQFGLRTQLFTEAANLTGPSGVFGHG